jgi:tripartite-type tricarboxylate transporter receptor subunit TctC
LDLDECGGQGRLRFFLRMIWENIMKLPRRNFLRLATGAAMLPALPSIAQAQAYPTRPVRLVVGFPPGGGADISARAIGQWLSERLNQQFIVDNRPGAGTNIATEAVVRSPPDGYTLLLATSANAINASLYEKLNFDFLRDIAPVAGIVRFPNVMLVNSQFPARTVPEFIAFAKANPGKINMASSGTGTSQHLSGELFKLMTGVDMVHVPFRGDAPALTDLLGGRVQVIFAAMASIVSHVRAGTLRALAVTTAARATALPDVPVLSDFVPGYEASGWHSIAVPRDTPTVIVEKLNREIHAGLAEPMIRARFADLGAMPITGSPTEFRKFVADEIEKWGKVVKFAGAKPD